MLFYSRFSISLFLIIILNPTNSSEFYYQKIDLSSNWTLLNKNLNISLSNIKIPNSVHTILHQNNLIDDPLSTYNDLKLKWISHSNDWTFRNEFQLDKKLLNDESARLNLHLESIDTVSTVYLNENYLGFTNNQFLKYDLRDLNSYLNLNGTNLLEIRFLSPIKHAEQLASIYPYRVPVVCPPKVQNGECHVNFLRKEQCSFSWDWGPGFAPIGINGPIYFKLVKVFDFDFSVSVYSKDLVTWILEIGLSIDGQNLDEEVRIKFEIKELHYQHELKINLNQRHFNIVLDLDSNKSPIELWWPSGYGKQNLYNLSVEIELDDLKNQKIRKEKTIGFRKVELVQEEIRPEGLSFYFRINDKPIFMKGSNWIPADLFKEKITHDYLRFLFKSAVEANMNILRVWGGGVYESELFYTLADQMGIMIWQDFMFACSTYPTNQEFLHNVELEVAYQVNRLRNHPSIILWAANNENEAALATNWYETKSNFELYAKDYRSLYIDTIMRTIVVHDAEQSRPFLSSSPTNGRLSAQSENWIAKNPYDLKYGDLHFYDYSINGWSHDSFPVPRFMSEFGVQSLPSYSTLADKYVMPDDANVFSRMNEHRQHHLNGNQEIVNEIQMNLKLPNINDRVDNFKAMIYLSQINQAMTLKTGSELYRRYRNILDKEKNNTGLCMGTMYWQFNDVWQAPTWSSIEYISNDFVQGGKWKMAHYYIKKAYANFLLSPFLNRTLKIDIYAVSDLETSVSLNATVKIFSFDSVEPKYVKGYELKVDEPTISRPVLSLDLKEIERATLCSLESNQSCILIIEWPSPLDKSLIESNFLFFKNRLADVTNLKKSNIEIVSIDQESEDLFSIDLRTDQVSLFVWLDIESSRFYGTFSDNGFHMSETKTKTIRFKSESRNVALEDLRQSLNVKTLANIYFSNK